MSNQWPWGTGPAPALRCDNCGRRIRGEHYILRHDNQLMLCSTCMDRTDRHQTYFPDCDKTWHDLTDHLDCSASRAAAWDILTDPERRRASS
jgi:hypothetical protein